METKCLSRTDPFVCTSWRPLRSATSWRGGAAIHEYSATYCPTWNRTPAPVLPTATPRTTPTSNRRPPWLRSASASWLPCARSASLACLTSLPELPESGTWRQRVGVPSIPQHPWRIVLHVLGTMMRLLGIPNFPRLPLRSPQFVSFAYSRDSQFKSNSQLNIG